MTIRVEQVTLGGIDERSVTSELGSHLQRSGLVGDITPSYARGFGTVQPSAPKGAPCVWVNPFGEWHMCRRLVC